MSNGVAMSDFSGDMARTCATFLGTAHPSFPSKLRLWLESSELRCVACYRFGQYADELRRANKVLGTIAVVFHRLWHWRVKHHDHTDIHRRARIGPGLLVMHRVGIIVGPTQIGANCVLHQNVTIGQRVSRAERGMPVIGNNVWIGPGATLTGSITIGDGATISAGSVVSKDVPPKSLVAGNPGRVILRDYDNSAMIGYAVSDK